MAATNGPEADPDHPKRNDDADWLPAAISIAAAALLLVLLGALIVALSGKPAQLIDPPTAESAAPSGAMDRAEGLTLLAILLAFLAYVAVNEEKIIKARKEKVQRVEAGEAKGDRSITALSVQYMALSVGDLLLILVALWMLARLYPPRLGGEGHGLVLRWSIAFIAAFFTAFHVFNWTRGYQSMRRGTTTRGSRDRGLCAGTYHCFRTPLAGPGRVRLIAHVVHSVRGYEVAWVECGGSACALMYRLSAGTALPLTQGVEEHAPHIDVVPADGKQDVLVVDMSGEHLVKIRDLTEANRHLPHAVTRALLAHAQHQDDANARARADRQAPATADDAGGSGAA